MACVRKRRGKWIADYRDAAGVRRWATCRTKGEAEDLVADKRRESRQPVVPVVDPNITAHAQPTGLNKGTLFVTVDSSVWLSEIVRYRRKEILDRLQHSFGHDFIARISFRMG